MATVMDLYRPTMRVLWRLPSRNDFYVSKIYTSDIWSNSSNKFMLGMLRTQAVLGRLLALVYRERRVYLIFGQPILLLTPRVMLHLFPGGVPILIQLLPCDEETIIQCSYLILILARTRVLLKDGVLHALPEIIMNHHHPRLSYSADRRWI